MSGRTKHNLSWYYPMAFVLGFAGLCTFGWFNGFFS
jgi:hypothetical protein